MQTNEPQLVIHDTPIALRFVGLVFAGIGAFIFFGSRSEAVFALLFVCIGAFMLVLTSNLTITADRLTRSLSLDYRSVLRHDLKQISFEEIAGIDVQQRISHSRGRTRHTYRVAIRKTDGQLLPLRSYYSSGSMDKQQLASQLSAFIGVPETGPAPMASFASALQAAQTVIQQQQEALTGPADGWRETNGVHWQVQGVAMGGAPAARWFSPDFKTPGSFLFLAQKPSGQTAGFGGGLLASLGNTLFKQSLSLYGFRAEDTPGLDSAAALAALDPRLEPDFAAFTNDPNSARQTLNPWAVMPLADWARRYPLAQFQMGARFGQLAVLFGPNGTYLAVPGQLRPDQADELTALGVELVRSQGGGGSSSASGSSSAAF